MVKRSRETVACHNLTEEKKSEAPTGLKFPGFTVIARVIPHRPMTSGNYHRGQCVHHQKHVEKTSSWRQRVQGTYDGHIYRQGLKQLVSMLRPRLQALRLGDRREAAAICSVMSPRVRRVDRRTQRIPRLPGFINQLEADRWKGNGENLREDAYACSNNK